MPGKSVRTVVPGPAPRPRRHRVRIASATDLRHRNRQGGGLKDTLLTTVHPKDHDATRSTKIIAALDVFGVKPIQDDNFKTARRGHCGGLLATIVVALLLVAVVCYSLLELSRSRYRMVSGEHRFTGRASPPADAYTLSEELLERGGAEHDPDRVASVPKMGISCCTESLPPEALARGDDPCDSAGYVQILFHQRVMQDQKKVKKEKLPSEPCEFDMHASSQYHKNFAGESHGVAAVCPCGRGYEMQGVFEDFEFRYLQVSINSCPWVSPSSATGVGDECRPGPEVEHWVRHARCHLYEDNLSYDITGMVSTGSATMPDPASGVVAGHNRNNGNDATAAESSGTRPVLSLDTLSRRFHYVHDTVQKIDIFHKLRMITTESWLIDLDFLTTCVSDLRYTMMEPVYQSTHTQADYDGFRTIMKLYMRLDKNRAALRLSPEADVFSTLSGWGAYYALLMMLGALAVRGCNTRHYAARAARDARLMKSFDSASTIVPSVGPKKPRKSQQQRGPAAAAVALPRRPRRCKLSKVTEEEDRRRKGDDGDGGGSVRGPVAVAAAVHSIVTIAELE